MKKNYYTLLSLSILTALYSTSSQASLQQQCLAGVPHFTGELIQGNPNDQPVYIEADNAELLQNSIARYEGDVNIKQGNRHLKAGVVEIEQAGASDVQRYAYAKNGFDYKDNLINLNGNNAKLHLNSKDANIHGADYQLVDRQGRGTADEIELRDNYRLMKNATFTSCLPNSNTWSIEAKEMRQYIQEEYAEMWHARFKVAGIPIFYTPYLQLPIGDRRRSGLLVPSAGTSSRDGYWYAQPIYWNIAPNFDATFTPKYMSHRGWQLNAETRYLTQIGEGQIAAEYLKTDRYSDYLETNRSRHLVYWNHSSSFLKDWRLNVNYTKVSDKRYFNDFESRYGSSTDGYADQNARIAYYQPNYNLSISAKQFQVFDEVNIGPYRALPQIDFNYYRNDIAKGLVDFRLFSQAVRFDNDSALMPTAWRFHIEPSLTFPLSNRYGSLNIETKLYATRYLQKRGKGENAEEVKKTVNRVLPQIKLDFQTVLANKQSFIDGYTQTLEPRLQYLYRPYRKQSDIGVKQRNHDYLGFGYDSTLLQQDYFSLFRDRRYSGLDRIASANQFTVGGTTRFYDKDANERFNLSIGQIYYLKDSRIDNNPQNSTQGRSSSWSLESNWRINDQWNWRGSYQYDTRLNQTSLANTVLEYNHEKNNLVQLSYRYASQSYIDQNLTGKNTYGQSIKQLGITAAWEVTDNWAVVGRYYQDIALKKPVEQYLGVQYNACCWSVGVGARRYVTSRANQQPDEILYDNSFNITFELRGLSPTDHKSGIDDMLEQGKLPYIRAFSLY
ncbi:LPS assembly protein LptD [Haemophilus haemoglobinophilus]|nr:LPS assembly protein LptD [Canicola haemoglobinophilus]MBN6712045.1 LPS assembly protein LptD [Canicola haemoglobinophilus]